MLSVILRRSASRSIAIRGGHGWDRPDVPLTIGYQHKRRMDVFDTNLWFYCGVMPEYFINQNEGYLNSAQNAIKYLILDSKYIIAAFAAIIFTYEVFYEARFWNIQPDYLKNPIVSYSRKVQQERPFLVKHFLDLSITGDMGMQRMTPGEKSFATELLETYEEQNKHIQLMNLEGKTYIERVEAESRQAVARRHGQVEAHHHHH
ncbi:unnamed protein product [Paramecium octaurelia]|uniref:Uncharacterized protein n=1 Tax=Paramecium octaurelia TaxID=43137 RepID=A0A8S1Y3Z0_PAROT|nr:unnamed protein product [Paramecium octaurelia]